jgi:aspartate/methionine/tyrosine aminotransferase
MRLNPSLQQIQPPPITEVKSWLAGRTFPAGRPLIDLCQAVPDYPPPAELIAHLQHCLSDPDCYRYSPDEGLAEVREDLCRWYSRHYQGAPTAAEVCLTIGASQAFWLAMLCLCQPGDEVIVPLPAYFDHLMGLQSYGLKPVCVPFDPRAGGLPDPAVIDSLISTKTRALLLVSPSNPTGSVIPPPQIDALFALAQARGISLILDETYNSFIGSSPHQLFERRDWQKHFIHLASFGKTFALTGLRCGALIAGAGLIEQALKLQDSMVVCQPRPAQLALQYGCRHLDHWIAANSQRMQQRHDAFVSCFKQTKSGFEIAASGSFFAWMRHPWHHLDSRQAARKLVDDANLICLPGEAFGPGLAGYLRLAFGNIATEQIPLALERLQAVSG